MEAILNHLKLPARKPEELDLVDSDNRSTEADAIIDVLSKFLECSPEEIPEILKLKLNLETNSTQSYEEDVISKTSEIIDKITRDLQLIEFQPRSTLHNVVDYLQLVVENISLKLSLLQSSQQDETKLAIDDIL